MKTCVLDEIFSWWHQESPNKAGKQQTWTHLSQHQINMCTLYTQASRKPSRLITLRYVYILKNFRNNTFSPLRLPKPVQYKMFCWNYTGQIKLGIKDLLYECLEHCNMWAKLIGSIFKFINFASRLSLKPKHIPFSLNQTSVYMRLVARKPVFGVCDQGRLKPACSATETK